VSRYEGSPSQRKKVDLNVDFVLVGIQIFKRDFDRFRTHFAHRQYHLAVDEATMIANVGSDNHQKVHEFAAGMTQAMLTGTPINSPMNAYGLLKFTNPGCYRNLKHFENMHVEERDFFGTPVKFQNLDVLRENLAKGSVRVLFEQMYPDVETPLFVPMPYDLAPDHLRLYQELAENQLLALEDGRKIDATACNNLTHALGQIVVNWGYFAGDDSNVSNALHMVQERLDELGDGKLVVFANYRMSVFLMVEHFAKVGAVAVNGDVTQRQKESNVTRFIEDPACRLIVINPKSGGLGLDGLQHVCHHMMVLEPMRSPRDFIQCVARLKRTGQRRRVVVALPTAEGTLQVRAFKALIDNDELASKVIHNAVDLRAAIFGR
jgi:SNF2 family DNA or RNA helicase